MKKKLMLILMAFSLVFAVTAAPVIVDAKRGGGGAKYQSPRKGVTDTPRTDNATRVDQNRPATGVSPAQPAAPARGGFFGGGFGRALLIGGAAGLLFGGLLGNLGALGSILGLLVNVLAVVLLFVLIRRLFVYFAERRRQQQPKGPYGE